MEKDVIVRKKVMISGFKVKEPVRKLNTQLQMLNSKDKTQIQILKESLQKRENEIMESLFDQNSAYNQTISTLKKFNEYKLKAATEQVERERKLSKVIEKSINQNLKCLAINERKLKSQKLQMQEKLNIATKKLLISEKLTTIGKRTTSFSHDVRNPLSLVRTQLEILQIKLLKEEDLNSKVAFMRIFYALNGIDHMIEQVLDYAREKPLQITETKLSNILRLCIMGIEIPENIKIKLPKEDYSILCDDHQMGIVFNNLILNAIESFEDGGIIEIKVSSQIDNILIEIQDSGSGISNDILEKIFEPQFTTKKTGTGFGLASCFRIITQHKGTINVQNNPTRFLIKLPKISKI